MNTTTCQPQNALQTLGHAIGTLFNVIAGTLIIAALAGMCLVIIIDIPIAILLMIGGVAQSIRANKTGEKPWVTDKTLYIAFYLFAITFMFMAFSVCVDNEMDSIMPGWIMFAITAMFTAYVVLRESLLPLLMRNSSRAVHTHMAWVLAILFWPVYGRILVLIGIPQMIFTLSHDLVIWLAQ